MRAAEERIQVSRSTIGYLREWGVIAAARL